MAEIGVTEFVRRQTPESKYDHFEGSWEELIALVKENWDRRKVSPHNGGVMLVPIPEALAGRFYAGVVEVTPDLALKAEFSPRVPGEDAFIQVSAMGCGKTPAKRVEIILYSHETLDKDGDAPPTREADYYIVSVNAYCGLEEEPMSPMTMARNFLGLKGGTRPEVPYTAEEFARSIVYWSRHARAIFPRTDG